MSPDFDPFLLGGSAQDPAPRWDSLVSLMTINIELSPCVWLAPSLQLCMDDLVMLATIVYGECAYALPSAGKDSERWRG